MNDVEEWRPVPGAEWYTVSTLGNIVSLRRADLGRGRRAEVPLHPHTGPCGLRVVNLMLPDGDRIKRTNVRVSTLVALAFLGDRPRELRVRHMNGNSLDDRLANLAYGTPDEVAADHVARARREEAAGAPTHCPQGHRYSDSYFGNYGDRFCSPCRWAERACYKDTEPPRTTCLDCGDDLTPTFPHRRKRCADCARRERNRQSASYQARKRAERREAKAAEVHRCQDCRDTLPPKVGTGPRPTRCAACRRKAQQAAERRYRERKRAGLATS